MASTTTGINASSHKHYTVLVLVVQLSIHPPDFLAIKSKKWIFYQLTVTEDRGNFSKTYQNFPIRLYFLKYGSKDAQYIG
jgi:hypothetical protein